jgi:hypothetical protein
VTPEYTTCSALSSGGTVIRGYINRARGQEFNRFRRKTWSKALHEFKLHWIPSDWRLVFRCWPRHKAENRSAAFDHVQNSGPSFCIKTCTCNKKKNFKEWKRD